MPKRTIMPPSGDHAIPAGMAEAVTPEVVQAMRQRAAAIFKLKAVAERNDVSACIADWDAIFLDQAVPVSAIAHALTTAMADLTEQTMVFNRRTTASMAASNIQDEWSASLRRVAARQGISLPQERGR